MSLFHHLISFSPLLLLCHSSPDRSVPASPPTPLMCCTRHFQPHQVSKFSTFLLRLHPPPPPSPFPSPFTPPCLSPSLSPSLLFKSLFLYTTTLTSPTWINHHNTMCVPQTCAVHVQIHVYTCILDTQRLSLAVYSPKPIVPGAVVAGQRWW